LPLVDAGEAFLAHRLVTAARLTDVGGEAGGDSLAGAREAGRPGAAASRCVLGVARLAELDERHAAILFTGEAAATRAFGRAALAGLGRSDAAPRAHLFARVAHGVAGTVEVDRALATEGHQPLEGRLARRERRRGERRAAARGDGVEAGPRLAACVEADDAGDSEPRPARRDAAVADAAPDGDHGSDGLDAADAEPAEPDGPAPACRGFATACAGQSTSECVAQAGCTRKADRCTGVSRSCSSYLSSYGCTGQPGCYWSASTKKCQGSAESCFAQYGAAACLDVEFCSWTIGACTGSAAPCAAFDDAFSCAGQRGCAWE
jgi:hypothetical protein